MAYVVPFGAFRGHYNSSSYFEPSSESVILIDLFQYIGFNWIKIFLHTQQYLYLKHIVVEIIHKSRSYRSGKEVIEHNSIYTSMRFWLQKLH